MKTLLNGSRSKQSLRFVGPSYSKRLNCYSPFYSDREQRYQTRAQEQRHCAGLRHTLKRDGVEMSDRRTDVCDIPRRRINRYEVSRSTASRHEIVAVECGAIEGESAVRGAGARRRSRTCDMSVRPCGRIIGPVLSWYRRAVKNASATDCQAATLGE